ncbi:MAG: hypothetical protein EOO04_11815 [Chitinophagaceae bacterium]|nr:MAG: hypothetical protein EOO04_11815 [Chitinophagaceae bacterium]
MKLSVALISGLAGSLALTALHQLLKGHVKNAPRMDKMGEQALGKILSGTGQTIPEENKLYKATLAGDIVGNALYYSVVGTVPGSPVLTGAGLGLAAGVGALVLPEKLGLNKEYSNATTKTQVLTVAIYLAGGLVAGLVQKNIKSDGDFEVPEKWAALPFFKLFNKS